MGNSKYGTLHSLYRSASGIQPWGLQSYSAGRVWIYMAYKLQILNSGNVASMQSPNPAPILFHPPLPEDPKPGGLHS